MTSPVETVTTERRHRGVFGWIFLIVFWLFNAFMAAWVFGAFRVSGEGIEQAASGAERAGRTIGSGIGIMLLLMIWTMGVIIIGAFVLLTRGKKVAITRTRVPPAPRAR